MFIPIPWKRASFFFFFLIVRFLSHCRRGEHLSKQVSEVKALIHMVLEGLRELQQLSAEPTASETDDGRSF